MSSPSGLYEWLALAGAVAGAVAVVLLVWNAVLLHRIRRSQKVVLGAGERDIVQHAAGLQKEFVALRDWLDEASGQLDARMSIVEQRLDGAVAHTAMLRYDAFGAMSGRQSSSVALLDEKKTGVVLSAIVHRSHSHLYVKQLHEGSSDIELSPEEQKVVDLAFAGGAPPQADPVVPQPPRVVTQAAAPEPSNPPAAGAAGG
ncbi:MAG: DUF4446 family protein [Solirubrobacterales bacterium]